MKRLSVYAGPNGSGKSSLRDAMGETTDVLIDPDQIARELNPLTPSAANAQAGGVALRRFHETVAAGKSISIETTLSGRTVLPRLNYAKSKGYRVELYYIALADIETNVVRVKLRADSGGHYIEPETIRRRAKSSFSNLSAAIALADRTVFFDNSDERHQRVLEINNGKIVRFTPAPNWLTTILPTLR